MDKSEILKEISDISWKAKQRMESKDLRFLPNHTTIDFLNEEELDRLYELKKMLPSRGDEIKNAKERIKQRIEKRNKRYDNS